MEVVEIRKMTLTDVWEVAQLEKEVFSAPWSEKSLEESLRRSEYRFLVAVSEHKIVGYIGMYQVLEEGDITNVAVHPKYQRRGIGSALVLSLLKEAGLNKIQEVTLEVRASNHTAIRLYEKNGFMAEGRRKNYYDKPKEDAVIMWNRSIQ